MLVDLSFRLHPLPSHYRGRTWRYPIGFQSCQRTLKAHATWSRQHQSSASDEGFEALQGKQTATQTPRYRSMPVGTVLRIGAHTNVKAAAGSIVGSMEGHEKVKNEIVHVNGCIRICML